jgi:hypothetical protein
MKTDLNISFEALCDACLYSSIAHAVSNLKHPFSSYAQSWEGMNYSFQYGSSRGTITFDVSNAILVGAFRYDKSDRTSWYPKFEALGLLSEAPETARELANKEAFQYLLDEFDDPAPPVISTGFWGRFGKKAAPAPKVTVPCVTTALWSEGDEIYSCDTLDDFNSSGGEFISEIMISRKELRAYLEVQYELTLEELELIDCLFQLKKDGKTKISLDSIPLVHGARSIVVNGERIEGDKEFIESLIEIGFEIKKE